MSSRLRVSARLIPALTVVLTAAAVLLVSACSDGDKNEETSGLTQEQSELKALASRIPEAPAAKIVYDLSSTFGGKPHGTWTLIQRPPDFRMDVVTIQDGDTELVATAILVDGEGTVCGRIGDIGTCTPVSSDEAKSQKEALSPAFNVPQAMAEETEKFEVLKVEERTIAGESARCFSVTSDQVGLLFHEGEICISDDGLLLVLKDFVTAAQFTREFIIKATEVNRTVSDADFEFPFPAPDRPLPQATPSPE